MLLTEKKEIKKFEHSARWIKCFSEKGKEGGGEGGRGRGVKGERKGGEDVLG